MSEILSLVLGSMHADMARLDRVAMNLANVQTTGYKRQIAVSLPFASRVDAGVSQQAPALALHTDQRPGTLKSTGQALDVALTTPGWFEVETPQGMAYTRQGNFRVDAHGRLVTRQGHPVMGVAGEIRLTQPAPVIDAGGRVFEGAASSPRVANNFVAQLKVARFEAGASVQLLGDGLVQVSGEPSRAREGDVRIQQGFLENSNVSQMQEMVQLLQAVRHMETMQKVATSYDEMLGASIRKLGEGA